MGVCFLCDAKLYGERTRVCSSITPHSNVPYPEKIVELMGEEFVVIVTPADHMCKRCTSLLTHMDKLENDLKLVKNALLSYIQKKYGILPPDQPVKTLDVVNGNLKTEEQLEAGPKKTSSSSTARDNVNTPLKMLKPPQTPSSDSSAKLKIYKCGFCTFQSKELGHVRFHMRTHVNKKENEKPTQTAAAKTLVPPPQKKRLYRCQVCSTSFDSRINCLDHIQKDHNQTSATAANEDKESEDMPSAVSSSTNFKQDTVKSQDNQQEDSTMDTDDNAKQDKNKGTVDTDMLLNNHVEDKETAEIEESKNTKETRSLKKSMPNQTSVEESELEPSGNAQEMPAQGADQDVSDNVKGEVEDKVGENKTGDLDIESMLAAIHNDNPPPDSSEPQNTV